MSQSYQVEIATTAEVEAKEAILWIRQFSTDAAKRFIEGFEKAIESLQQNPFRCPLAPENDVFYQEIRQLLYGKYRILITIDEETVYVLHVRHSSQKYIKQEFEDK